MFFSLFKGFGTTAGLIVAIGAQNAFVMRQGFLRRHLFLTALLCSLIDTALIILGVLGFGKMISLYPLSILIANYFAMIFLTIYGAISFRSAFKPRNLVYTQGAEQPVRKTILLLLAFSLLNPHVYLDTVILLGSIASQQPGHHQPYFALGAIAASFTWFFTLTYGCRLLTPYLQKPKIWRAIDLIIAITMWSIAATLWIKR
jgi:L-lysine exporter family protein LysE/ArgO